MVWNPQTYASKNILKTISVGSLRMTKRGNVSDEADDESSEDCRPGVYIIKGKKCSSLHEELRPKRVQFDIPPASKKNSKTYAAGRESPAREGSDRPSSGTSPKRDLFRKRSETPPPTKSRTKECNFLTKLQDCKGKLIQFPCVSRIPYQVGLVTPTTNDFQEKRVQFDLNKIPRIRRCLKHDKSVWEDAEGNESDSSGNEPQCPLNKPIERCDRTKSAKEPKKYVEHICDKKKEAVDRKIENHSSASSISREGKCRPKEYVSGGWRIRLDSSARNFRDSAKPESAPVGSDSVDHKESFSESSSVSPSREQSMNFGGDKFACRKRCREMGQSHGRERPLSACENHCRETRNKFEPVPPSSWKCALRRTSFSAGNSPHESIVQFNDPRMWSAKESPKREDHSRDFPCPHKVTKKCSLTQDESMDSDEFPICTIDESLTNGNSLRTKLQIPVHRSNTNDGREMLEFSHAQSLDMYSTDTDTTDVNRRSISCPLRRKVRRSGDGISASMRQECVETESQIHFKIESQIKIDIPNKGKEKFMIEGQEKKPIGILRKTVPLGEEEDTTARSTESQPTIVIRPSLSLDSSSSKTGFVASLVSEDIVFPEREHSPPSAEVKLWIEPESSDSPLYQTVSPCCESSTSMEGTADRRYRHEHFKGRSCVKKEDASSAPKTDANTNSESSPERKARGKDFFREISPRKPPHRKVESSQNADLNQHRNFGCRAENVKGETKPPKLTFPPNPMVESKFVAKKRVVEKKDADYRVESTRSESSIASSSSCYHSNVNLRSLKNSEEKKTHFGYSPRFLRQTVKQTKYESKYIYDPSSSNNETADDLGPSMDSTAASLSARKYKPLLRDVLRYLPPTPNLRIPPHPTSKAQGADPIIPTDSTLDRLNHALGRDEVERPRPIQKDSSMSQDMQLRGVSIGSSLSWCGPQGSLTAMTKSLLYVDQPVDSQSSQCIGASPSTGTAAKKSEMKMEKALKKSVTSGSFTSAHSKVSLSVEETYDSCACPRMIGCADKRKMTVASQTHITGLEVQDNRSIINILDTTWELKKYLHEKKGK